LSFGHHVQVQRWQDGVAILEPKKQMLGTIGERSDAVFRTAMASEATPFFERLWPDIAFFETES
jgi:hypothetical protein